MANMERTGISVLVFCIVITVVLLNQATAQMSSTNYRIPTTVVSGGGGPMGSANFQMNSTAGQPSPIMEQGMDPYSDNYGLLPGFWYTLPSTATDDPPVIDNINYDGCISELCTTTLVAIAHDPAGGTLAYEWDLDDDGSVDGTGDSFIFDPPVPSALPDCDPYFIKLTVTSDASGLSIEEIVGITVKLAGDADGNGVVNILDKVAVRNAFGSTGPQPADVNCDNVVNILDKVVVRNQFGQSGCGCP